MEECVLTMCLAALRTEYWREFYDSLCLSCEDVPFEVIFVTPHYDIPQNMKNIDNVRFVHDFGSLSRCTQIGSCISRGKLFSWPADDCMFFPGAVKKSVEVLLKMPKTDAMVGKYCEGRDFRKNPRFEGHPDTYWYPKLHWPSYPFPSHYKMDGIGMLYLEYYKELGGLDCQYDMVAVATHDLYFRLQNSGGTVHIDPEYMAAIDFDPDPSQYRDPLTDGYYHDLQIHAERYGSSFPLERVKIDFDNWKNTKTKWRRFI